MRVQSTDTRGVARLVVLAVACAGAWGDPVVAGSPTGSGAAVDAAAAERGRLALTLKGFLEARMVRGRLSQMRPGCGTSRLRILITIPRATPPRSVIATACTRPLSPTMGCRWACAGVSARAV